MTAGGAAVAACATTWASVVSGAVGAVGGVQWGRGAVVLRRITHPHDTGSRLVDELAQIRVKDDKFKCSHFTDCESLRKSAKDRQKNVLV